MGAAMPLLVLILLIACQVNCEPGDNEFRTSLEFVSELRICSFGSSHIQLKLPTLSLFAPTLNPTVTQIVKEKYVAFWQEMQQHDFRRYTKRLVELSKGAYLPFYFNLKYFRNDNGKEVIQYLKPLFKGNLIKHYLECLKSTDADKWRCLQKAIEKNVYDEVDREMSLCAHHLLDMAVDIEERGEFDIRYYHREALRSDEHALDCIRKWDRIFTIPKILYLTFLLHARKLIAHLTGDQVQSKIIANMQMQLERLIDTEFPKSMRMMEVKREAVNGTLIYNVDVKTEHSRVVNEVRLFVIEQYLYDDDKIRHVLYLENDVVYISTHKDPYEKKPEILQTLFEKVMKDLLDGNLIMRQNPMFYSFK